MGVRANLFDETRKCVNVLKGNHTGVPFKSKMTPCNFPLSIMSVTRRHLKEAALSLIDSLEKETFHELPIQLRRYYKLSALHMSQLKRYKKKMKNEKIFVGLNIIYLQKLSYMMSKLSKTMYSRQCRMTM